MNADTAPLRLHLVCCEIFYREVCRLIADAPHRIDVEFLPKGLHDQGVERMRPRLQACLNAVPPGAADAILLGYGLCNNGAAGLVARHTRLVVPRAHDCITLFMGSRSRYRAYFDSHPGTYYRTTGWIEREDPDSAGDDTVQRKLGLFMRFEELVEQYGEDNARYIMETMGTGVEHYSRLAYIRTGLPADDAFQARAETEAREKGWTFDAVQGSLDLLERLLGGRWDDDFLVVEPGHTIAATYDDTVIRAVPCPA